MKILAALLCLTAFATSAQADSRYRTTATIGPVTEVVVLDELHMLETDVYRLAIADSRACRRVLRGEQCVCKVLFWSDESFAPKRLPMMDRQAEAQTAAWTLNLCTDYRQMIWSCRIAPKLDHRPDRSDCF